MDPRSILVPRWRMAAIVVLGFAVRAWGLGSQSLSMDELADTLSAKAPVAAIVHTADGFPPLFGLLFHAWFTVFPHDGLARWFSVAVGVLTLIPMWRLGTRVGDERVGLTAALALALSPLHVGISQEARAYALYLLFAVLALWLYLRALDTNRARDWLLYVLACTAGVYTHYYFALLPFTAGVLLVAERRLSRPALPGVLAHAALLLVALSLVPSLRSDLAYQADYPHEAPFNLVTLAYAYYSLVAGFYLGPSLRELHTIPAGSAVRSVLPWATAAAGAVVALAWAAWQQLRESHAGRLTATRLVVLLSAPMLAGGILAEVLHVGFRVRYLAWVAVPLLLVLAIGAARVTDTGARRVLVPRAALGMLATVWAVALVDRRRAERHWNEDAAALATYLRANARPVDPVFVMSDYMAVPVAYYLGPGWRICPLPNVGSRPADPAKALRVISSFAARDSTFWLVYSRPFHSDPEGQVPRTLLRTGAARERARFAGVTLYEGRTRFWGEQASLASCQPVLPPLATVLSAPGREIPPR